MHSNGMVNLVNKFFEMQHIDALRSLGYIHKAGHQVPHAMHIIVRKYHFGSAV